MLDKKLINSPVSYLGKIGIVTDCFYNDSQTEAYIRYRTAESIVRSIGKSSDELIPLDENAIVSISQDEFYADIDAKKELATSMYKNGIEIGMNKFINHDGEFVTTAANMSPSEPFILWFRNDKRVLIESAIGELKLVFHPKMYRSINKDEAIKLATSFHKDAIGTVIKRIDEFKAKYGN